MTNGIIIQRMNDRDTAVEVSDRVSRPKSRKLRIDSADSEMSVHVRAKYKCDPYLRFGAVVELSPELVNAITTIIRAVCCFHILLMESYVLLSAAVSLFYFMFLP